MNTLRPCVRGEVVRAQILRSCVRLASDSLKERARVLRDTACVRTKPDEPQDLVTTRWDGLGCLHRTVRSAEECEGNKYRGRTERPINTAEHPISPLSEERLPSQRGTPSSSTVAHRTRTCLPQPVSSSQRRRSKNYLPRCKRIKALNARSGLNECGGNRHLLSESAAGLDDFGSAALADGSGLMT